MRIRLGQPQWNDVSRHLDRLLELPETDRAAELAKLQLEQPDVADTVRELLTNFEEREGFLETGVVRFDGREGPGTQIGAYTLQFLIGTGGMGEVWLARRSDGRFEGQCAIKILHWRGASVLGLERFRREGRLLARLSHAHIARLMDAGVTDQGRPYLILEYVQGERIDAYCNSRSLGTEARVRLLVDVLDALAHAHSSLIIHRDIKPSNILVTPAGEVKLLDFGVAKLLSAETGSEDASPATRSEDWAFTPEYAAPEQILGEPPSTATDVYQVGLMMFVLLAGRLPQGKDGATRAQRVRAALEGEAEHLADAAPAHLRRALRGDLGAIASRALRRVPQQRYATAAALGDDLKRYLARQPVAARAGALGYRVRQFVRRHRGTVIASGAIVLALIATTLLTLVQLRETQQQRDQSLQSARRAQKQAESLSLMVSIIGSGRGTPEQLLDTGRQLVREHYSGDPEFQGNALVNLAARYEELGLLPKEQSVLLEAYALAPKLADPSVLARVQCGLASVEIELGHLDRAASYVAAGNAALKGLQQPDPIMVESCVLAESRLADMRRDHSGAIRLAERALALLEQAHATHELLYVQVLSSISEYYGSAGDQRKAFEMAQRALRAAQDDGLGSTPAALGAMHNLSFALYEFGEVQEACALEKNVVERLLGSGTPIHTAILVYRGKCLLRAGQAARALVWFDKALHMSLDQNDFMLQLYALESRAQGLTALRRLSAAGADLKQAVALVHSHGLPTPSVPLLRLPIRQAQLLFALRRPEAAWKLVASVLPIARDPQRGEQSELGAALLLATRIAAARGKYLDALALASEALREAEHRARDPNLSADVGEAALLLAQCRRALHDEPGMRSAAQQAVTSLTASLGPDHPLTKQALGL